MLTFPPFHCTLLRFSFSFLPPFNCILLRIMLPCWLHYAHHSMVHGVEIHASLIVLSYVVSSIKHNSKIGFSLEIAFTLAWTNSLFRPLILWATQPNYIQFQFSTCSKISYECARVIRPFKNNTTALSIQLKFQHILRPRHVHTLPTRRFGIKAMEHDYH